MATQPVLPIYRTQPTPQTAVNPYNPQQNPSAPTLSREQQLQQLAQANVPLSANNGNPRGANNMGGGGMGRQMPNLPNNASRYPVPQFAQQPYSQGAIAQRPSPERQTYINGISGQQADLGRYRPPTLAGDGNNPMNWNDYGGYAYNLPYAFGPTQQRGNANSGPYGGYPSYLVPSWNNRPLPEWV